MKKIIFVIILILLVGAIGAGLYMYQQKKQITVVSPQPVENITPTPMPLDLVNWKDPAGFTFDYPKDVSVNKHDEDQQNYAHVELTHKDHPGTTIVWAKDTTARDVDSWVKTEKTLAGGTVFDTTLGGLDGKKVLVTTPQRTVVSAVVDEAVVFYVEGVFDESEFWTRAYDAITSSFAFSSSSQEASTSDAGAGGEESFDEEEIIE
jgi:hypothetical protein